MASLLPHALRCLRMVTAVLARHVYAPPSPLQQQQQQQDDADATLTSSSSSMRRLCGDAAFVMASYYVLYDADATTTTTTTRAPQPLYRSPLCYNTSQPTWPRLPECVRTRHGHLTRVILELYVCTPSARAAPVATPPPQQLQDAHETAVQQTTVTTRLLARVHVDLTTSLTYVAATVTDAEQREWRCADEDTNNNNNNNNERTNDLYACCTTTTQLLLRCVDGVYAVTPTTTTMTTDGVVSAHAAWTRSPGSVGCYDRPDTHRVTTRDERARRVSVGAHRALAVSTRMWAYLQDMAAARAAAQRHVVDTLAIQQQQQQQQQQQRQQQQSSTTQTQGSVQTTRVTADEAPHTATAMTAAASTVATTTTAADAQGDDDNDSDCNSSSSIDAATSEAARTRWRARLARERRRHVRALRHMFVLRTTGSVHSDDDATTSTSSGSDDDSDDDSDAAATPPTQSSSSSSSSTTTATPGTMATAAMTLCGMPLPVLTVHHSGAVALQPPQSRAAAEEEALALSHAAHVLDALATLYACTLPHPVVIAGVRSCVLARPDASVRAVATAVLLPARAAATMTTHENNSDNIDNRHRGCTAWHSSAVAAAFFGLQPDERRGVALAVRLLVADARAIAAAMSRRAEMRVAACGWHLGAVLHTLLRLHHQPRHRRRRRQSKSSVVAVADAS